MSDKRRGDGNEKSLMALPNFADFTPPDLVQITSNMVSTWSEVNSSLMSFAQASIQNNLAAAEELRQVQNPKDLLDTQMRIARRAYDDYLEEATKIGQIVQKLSAGAIDALNPQKPN